MKVRLRRSKNTLSSQDRWTPEESLEKFRLYRKGRDLAVRDEIVSEYMPLVYGIAHHYSSQGEPVDDLIQEGSIGLMRAVDHYDPDRGVKFSTYACHLITSQILHYLRDCGHLIRQPAWVQELNSRVTRAIQLLTHDLNREPVPAEIAEYLNLTEDSVLEVLSARELNRIVSLTAPADNNENTDILIIDKERIHQKRYETLHLPIEDRIVLEEAINGLKSLERSVLRLFFFGEMSLSEIARRLSISTPRSSYLLRRSLDKIKVDLEQQRNTEQALLETPSPLPEPGNGLPIYDKTTGVHSRAYLQSRLREELARSQRDRISFSLLLVQVHNITGKDMSEQLILAAIGQTLCQIIHASDIVGYLGDGLFGLLMLQSGIDAQHIGERICREVNRQHGDDCPDGLSFFITVGYAVFPLDGITEVQLLQRARTALQSAGKANSGSVVRGTMQKSSKK